MQRFINNLLNLPVHPIQTLHLNNFWTIVVALGWLYLLAVFVPLTCLFGITILRSLPLFISALYRKLGHEEQQPPQVFLELAFPSDMSKSAYATEQLHLLLGGQYKYRDFLDKLAGRKKLYSLELVGTNNEGIRYVLVVPGDDVERIQRSLLSFLPALKIKQVSDYMDSLQAARVSVNELKLSEEFAYPLKDHKALEEHDPFAYFAGHMTKLARNELVAIQLVVTPVRRSTHMRVLQRAQRVRGVIGRGNILTPELSKRTFGIPRTAWICLLLPIWVAVTVLKIALAMVVLFSDSHRKDIPFFGSDNNKRNPGDLYEQELASIVKIKLDQNLFEISLRIFVAADSDEAIDRRSSALVSAYHMFASPYQSFTTRRYVPLLRKQRLDRLYGRYLKRRLTPSLLSYGSIVSSSELSDLYHFPNTNMVKTEGFVKSRSRELPAPLSLKHSDAVLDVIVGANSYGGEDRPIGMTLEQRQKHTYLIGKTGTGKTTLLKSSIYQDMVNGKGLAVLDPHGDMFRELLAIVPEHRRKDVIVLDPSDRAHPPGLNILSPGIHFESEEDSHSWIASSVLTVFAKLTDEAFWGPRMEHILRSTVLTALQLPNPSLYTLQRLLTDKKYQRSVAFKLKDPVLKAFWLKEMLPMGNMQLSSAVAPLTHRLGHFLTDTMSRHILLQEKSSISISDIMDRGKILLVNLSKGDIGEDQSFFFGTILTSLIWMAAYQRTKIPEEDRRDFFVYIDEFQNFAAPRFAEIASEGRKFHVALIVSHQNIAQIQDQNILKVMAGNSHTIICLKASPDDEAFILPYMDPVVEKGDIINLAPYHFFMKTTTDESEDAFSGVTAPLTSKASSETKAAVIASSRELYAVPKKEVEQYLKQLFAVDEKPGEEQKSTARQQKKGPKQRKTGL